MKALLLISTILGIHSCSPKSSSLSAESSDTETYLIESPDKAVAVQFRLSESQQALYAIRHNDTLVLEDSELGVMMEDQDFTKGLKLKSVSDIEPVTDTYKMAHGKKQKRIYEANRQVFHLASSTGSAIDIIFQVSNDGVAFRYYFPEQSSEKRRIKEEVTSYNFPEDAKAWLQPMSKAKTGFAETNPSYEEHYLQDIPVGTPSPLGEGWIYPALFRSGNSWLLITESALDGDYCGTHLSQASSGGKYKVAFPQEKEVMPGGALNPESALPWYSPWRVIAVGGLKNIVESTLGTDLAKPAIDVNTAFIKPGKASWSWALLKDESIVYDVQKRFIDYAADMNWNYCLVDVNWDQNIGYEKIKELAAYGNSKNVGLILWYNSSGPWNNTEYTPKSKLLTHEDRVKEFSRLREMGIKGVKVDFFGGDGQSVIQYYIDILKDAAANELLVNFHGSTLPRGWHRTYPNLMTMEAIKGFEFITFEQGNADQAPTHAAMLPFTRNAFDPMDFTPVSLYKIPRIDRKTTNGFELAQSILFLSGIQHYAETPEGMEQVPNYVKEFMKEVPSSWEETRYIDGYPGKLAVIARKANEKWYVAGINGESKAKSLNLDLSFLDNKKGYMISDGQQEIPFSRSDISLASSGRMEVKVNPNGGFVMVFE